MKIPMGKQAFKVGKKIMNYLYNDNGVVEYLNNPDNLMTISSLIIRYS
jgi:hypothetical protein